MELINLFSSKLLLSTIMKKKVCTPVIYLMLSVKNTMYVFLCCFITLTNFYFVMKIRSILPKIFLCWTFITLYGYGAPNL